MSDTQEPKFEPLRIYVREKPDVYSPDYVFQGREVAKVTSRKTESLFWTEITAYETMGKQIVVHTKGCALDGEKTTIHKVMVFKSDDEMMIAMGITSLHRRLWRRMGITEFVIA